MSQSISSLSSQPVQRSWFQRNRGAIGCSIYVLALTVLSTSIGIAIGNARYTNIALDVGIPIYFALLLLGFAIVYKPFKEIRALPPLERARISRQLYPVMLIGLGFIVAGFGSGMLGSGDTTALAVSSTLVGVGIIVSSCCFFYRRWKENKEREQKEQQNAINALL